VFERSDRVWQLQASWLKLEGPLPSEVGRNMYFSMIDEPIALKNRHDWDPGSDHIMWETDYPHSETSWPHAQKTAQEIFQGIPDDEVQKISHGNAVQVFNWEIRIPPDASLPN
jgi:predicted TIM-barrel fold metal-dependent hydrolase